MPFAAVCLTAERLPVVQFWIFTLSNLMAGGNVANADRLGVFGVKPKRWSRIRRQPTGVCLCADGPHHLLSGSAKGVFEASSMQQYLTLRHHG